MDSFFDQIGHDRTLMMGLSNYQDFCTHLHLAGVYDTDFIRSSRHKGGKVPGVGSVSPSQFPSSW
jgi:hypothetical protein